MDIAGPAAMKAAKPPLCHHGTGFGTHTLLHYLFKDEIKKEN